MSVRSFEQEAQELEARIKEKVFLRPDMRFIRDARGRLGRRPRGQGRGSDT